MFRKLKALYRKFKMNQMHYQLDKMRETRERISYKIQQENLAIGDHIASSMPTPAEQILQQLKAANAFLASDDGKAIMAEVKILIQNEDVKEVSDLLKKSFLEMFGGRK